MFRRKLTIPREFESDNLILLSSSTDHVCKMRKVREETEVIDQQNKILAGEIDHLKSKIDETYIAELSYKEIKAQRKAAGELNKKLEKQALELRNQLQMQKDLEDKCRSEETKKQRLITANRLFNSHIVELQNRLENIKNLEDEYKVLKATNKTMSQQQDVLQQRAEELRQRVNGQDQVEKKIKTKQTQNQALKQRLVALQHEIQHWTVKLKDKDNMTAQYTRLTNQHATYMGDFNYLESKVQEMKTYFGNVKHQLTKNNNFPAMRGIFTKAGGLHGDCEALLADFNDDILE
ncbi:Hypothetical predicted protein [Scomber scombrus]|uniref:Uncharacterized protein n=1 Tax=Scomber scombrus TaxID=13677 RepID=A0AAV1NL83_SCOSC